MPNPLGMNDDDWGALIGTIAGEYGLGIRGQSERDTMIGAAMIADVMANRQDPANRAYAGNLGTSLYGMSRAANCSTL